MNIYKSGNFTDTPFNMMPGEGRSLLQVYTGENISEREASSLLERIADHKWYVSQKLERDVGFHVAAIDYVENFYQPPKPRPGILTHLAHGTIKAVRSAVTSYLKAKGRQIPL